nr:hypothetical protein [Gammaproteobacteria bacterium]
MTSASIEHNRRAVYSALSRTTDDRMLTQQSYDLWEQRYASTSVFRVAQFIEDLVKDVGLGDALRRNLAIALYAALGQNEGDLAEVPSVVRNGTTGDPGAATIQQPGPAVAGNTGSPAETVFAHLVDVIVNGIAKQGKENLNDLATDILAHVPKLPDAGVAARVTGWAESQCDPAQLPTDMSTASMSSLVHAIYVSACRS